jgi:hypothetical protein
MILITILFLNLLQKSNIPTRVGDKLFYSEVLVQVLLSCSISDELLNAS